MACLYDSDRELYLLDAKVPTIVMNTDIDATTTPMTMSKPAAGSEEAIEEGKTTEGAF